MRLQRAYLYLASLVSLLAFAFGLVNLASGLIYLWFAPDRPPVGVVDLLTHPVVAPWLVWTVVAALLWVAHWLLADRVARTLTIAGAGERNAPIRKAYLYIGQLALLMLLGAEAILMLYSVLLALLGLPAADLYPWPARALAPAAGTVIALGFWIYLRRVAVSDGDFGHELGTARAWRRGYFYAGIALATMVAGAGAGEFLRTFLRVAGQVYSFGIQAGEPDSWRRLGAASMAAALVAFPAVVSLWRKTNRIAAEGGSAEVNAIDRKLLLYGGRAAGAGITLVSLGFVLWQILLIVLGQFPADARAFWENQLAPPLAYLPVGLILWLFYGSAGRGDIVWVEESRESAVLRRIYYYLMAALGLAAFWYGVQALFVLALLLAFGIWAPSLLLTEAARRFFSLSAALALVGGPVWWAHWRPQQLLARQEGPVGYEERGSLLRRIYLYAVAAVGAVVAVFSLGVVLYQAPGWLFGPGSEGNFIQAVVQFGVAITMALIWWIAHGLVLRGDQRLLAQDEESLGAFAEPPTGSESEAAVAPGRAAPVSDSARSRTEVPGLGRAAQEPAETRPSSSVLGVPAPLAEHGERDADLPVPPAAAPQAPLPSPAAPSGGEAIGRVRRFQRDALRANLPSHDEAPGVTLPPQEEPQPSAGPSDLPDVNTADATPAGAAAAVPVTGEGAGGARVYGTAPSSSQMADIEVGPALPVSAQPTPAEPSTPAQPASEGEGGVKLYGATPASASSHDGPLVVVVDGGDGALGRDLLAALRKAAPNARLWPLAFNSVAYDAMLEGLGVRQSAPMPDDVLSQAAVILGPSDMVAPGGLNGEVPAELAAAMAASPARKVLLPPRNPRLRWVAAPDWPRERWVGYAVAEVVQALGS